MTGQNIAHYRITEKLGQGGMGVVYRASDTKLDREVAIKVLPENFSQDADRVVRFSREAKLLAALNHPNIAAIYGVEEFGQNKGLVMELVEGETLADRIRRGPLPVEEVLDVCKQTAEALEFAHLKGIIHRDLKPANIKITPDGKVKVLDFGLAKALTTDSTTSRPVDDDSPTITGDHTLPGVVLGTASYMSPEQVRGKPLDKRTDIWSWGCVFVECLTGKRLFRGEDLAETMALIMKSEPTWADLPTTTPSAVALLLRKCLRKDRRHRLQDIGDARVDLEEAIQNPERSEFTGPAGLTSERKRALFALAILIGLLGASLAWALKPSASRREPPPAIRAEVNPFGNQPLGTAGITIALSPNGEWLAYKVGHVTDGSSRILLRNLHDGRDIVLAGTEGGGGPFFSPDGAELGFSTRKELRRIQIPAGTPSVVCNLRDSLMGATWMSNNIIVFATGEPLLQRVAASGGEPSPIQVKGRPVIGRVTPQALPDGRILCGARGDNQIDIEVINPASGESLIVQKDAIYGLYLTSGRLLFVQDHSLFATPFDLKHLKVANGAINVQQRVACDTQMGFADCAVSETGALAYIKAAPQNDASEEKEVVWMNVEGKTKLAIPDRGAYIAPSLSRSGSKLAVTIEDKDKTRGGSRSHIEILDFARPILQQLTPPAEKPFGPLAVSVWSPDERWVYFNRREDGKWGIFRKRSDFRGEIENVVLGGDALMVPQSFSPDGKLFTYWEAESQSQKSSMMVTEAEGGNKPRPINEEVGRMVAMPEISPGGEWLAYVVQPPGGTAEIYVSPFLRTGALMQVSKGGGTLPRWSPAEKRLFFLSAEEPRIMAVDYTMTTEKTFTATLPREILKIPANIDPVWFGVNTNGREFLVTRTIKPVETSSPGETNNARCVSLVINWFTELEQKVPIRKE